MQNNIHVSIRGLTGRFPELLAVEDSIRMAFECLVNCYQQGGKVLICGNGGSCSDSDHITGELMKGFELKRPLNKSFREKLLGSGSERGIYLSENLQQGLPAISLSAHSALLTAIANDMDFDLVYAQQVVCYGKAGDVIIGISTSGNSQNVIDAFITAKAKGMIVIGLTGESGGRMKPHCDILINLPGTRTASVQELMIPVYHTLCRTLENYFFGNQDE